MCQWSLPCLGGGVGCVKEWWRTTGIVSGLMNFFCVSHSAATIRASCSEGTTIGCSNGVKTKRLSSKGAHSPSFWPLYESNTHRTVNSKGAYSGLEGGEEEEWWPYQQRPVWTTWVLDCSLVCQPTWLPFLWACSLLPPPSSRGHNNSPPFWLWESRVLLLWRMLAPMMRNAPQMMMKKKGKRENSIWAWLLEPEGTWGGLPLRRQQQKIWSASLGRLEKCSFGGILFCFWF